MPDEKLKPCEICGNPKGTRDCLVMVDTGTATWVRCGDCGAEGPPAKTGAKAIKLWNKREPSDA